MEIQKLYNCPIYLKRDILKLSRHIESFVDPLFIYSLKCHGLPYLDIRKTVRTTNRQFMEYIYFTHEGASYCLVDKPANYYLSCVLYPELVDIIICDIPQQYYQLYFDVISHFSVNFQIMYPDVNKLIAKLNRLDKETDLVVAARLRKILYFFIDKDLFIQYTTHITRIRKVIECKQYS